MSSPDINPSDSSFQRNAMAAFIQIAMITLLVLWCFAIIQPFVNIILWAVIISVALYPSHRRLTDRFGGRAKSSATIIVLIGMLVLVLPSIFLAESSIGALKATASSLKDGTVSIPVPDASIAEWPIVGEKLYTSWNDAATNLEATLNQYEDQLVAIGHSLASSIGSAVLGFLQLLVSLIIAGVFLVTAEAGHRGTLKFADSLVGDNGSNMVDLAVATVRSVAKGVLGVAIIQATLAAIGLVAIGVPAAGVWAFLILMLAIMQLPPLLILGPIAIWVYSVSDPIPATIFLVYAFVVSISDSFLKPLLLGRGVDVPMLVILIGAIGGMLLSGIIGLFIGAIVLALGYKLLSAWMDSDEQGAIGAGDSTTEAP